MVPKASVSWSLLYSVARTNRRTQRWKKHAALLTDHVPAIRHSTYGITSCSIHPSHNCNPYSSTKPLVQKSEILRRIKPLLDTTFPNSSQRASAETTENSRKMNVVKDHLPYQSTNQSNSRLESPSVPITLLRLPRASPQTHPSSL